MNLADILKIKYPTADFLSDINLAKVGEDTLITFWNTEKLGPQPTQQDIDQWNADTGINLQYLQSQIEYLLRKIVESKPVEKGYDSIATLSSYITSSNAQWKAEAEAFIAWRDSLFAFAYSELNQVQTGQIQPPSIDEFISSLPSLVWPS